MATGYTDGNVNTFIEGVDNDQKKKDSYRLTELMKRVSGEEPRMFGPSIIGFGEYRYTYDSGHEGTAPLIGFSPRKSAISLYVYTGDETREHLLNGLGKFTMGKACIYVKKMADIHEDALVKLMEDTLDYLSKKYTRI
ncbi:DUF1801 domain-containing protein [Leadbetterella sp. DM7]|uniref:DUF1801 domain-containing protein n=1 Tax=Leadbetterella sp. DM7 TaxID=3235085 RepID=UPI00349EF145